MKKATHHSLLDVDIRLRDCIELYIIFLYPFKNVQLLLKMETYLYNIYSFLVNNLNLSSCLSLQRILTFFIFNINLIFNYFKEKKRERFDIRFKRERYD